MKKYLLCILLIITFSCEEHKVQNSSESLGSSSQKLSIEEVKINPGDQTKSSGQTTLISVLAQNHQTIHIQSGMNVLIDQSVDIDKIMIEMGGRLSCDESIASPIINLKVKAIMVHGEFVCGSEANPYGKKLNIILKHNPSLDPRLYIKDANNVITENPQGVNYRTIHVMGGKLKLFGSHKNIGWDYIAGSLQAGSNKVLVMKPTGNSSFADNWSVGDKIIVGPTGFNHEEAESFRITEIDKTKYQNRIEFTLDHPAEFYHHGDVQTLATQSMGQVTLNERAEIANLSRSIKIQPQLTKLSSPDQMSAPYDQVGGHVMVMNHGGMTGQAYIDAVEFYKMGQAGIMARYPFHWHKSGDVQGQFIKNSSVHESYQRCITVHQTNFAEVRNNVCYNFKGHGYFLEDGSEIQNTLIRNLAMRSQFPSENKILLSSEDFRKNENGTSKGGNQYGRFHAVASFWISNPDNNISWNVASGSVGTGFWNAFKNQFQGDDGIPAFPNKTPTLNFKHNIAHAAIIGMTWDGAEASWNASSPQEILDRNPDSKIISNSHYAPANGQVPVFEGLKVFKNRLSGIYMRSNTNVLINLIAVNNGWALWNAYNNIVKDSVIIGNSENDHPSYFSWLGNQYPRRPNFHAGVIVYDGPFEVHNTDFINFSSSPIPESQQRGVAASVYTPYRIPIMSIGGAKKFVNVTSGLQFTPDPYHRAFIFDEYAEENASPGPHILGESMIRDLDGSLIGYGSGGYLTGNKSMGTPIAGVCTPGGSRLKNYLICPEQTNEYSFVSMKIKNSGSGKKSLHPQIIRRISDGMLNLEKEFWGNILNDKYKNLKFNLSSNPQEIYQVVTDNEYKKNKDYVYPNESEGHHLEVVLNGELLANDPNFEIGIIRYVGYGKNCRLEHADMKNSLYELRQSKKTSYFTDGLDLNIKLVPNKKFFKMNNSAEQQAKAYESYVLNGAGEIVNHRRRIICDDELITSHVVGRIDNVAYGSQNTVVNGWACNLRRENPANIRVQLSKPKSITVSVSPVISANLSAEPAINFQCASIGLTAARFTATIPNSTMAQYPNHKIRVLGISTTQGGQNRYLSRSGEFPAVQ